MNTMVEPKSPTTTRSAPTRAASSRSPTRAPRRRAPRHRARPRQRRRRDGVRPGRPDRSLAAGGYLSIEIEAQNGAPDGVALVDTTAPGPSLDAFSYEGAISRGDDRRTDVRPRRRHRARGHRRRLEHRRRLAVAHPGQAGHERRGVRLGFHRDEDARRGERGHAVAGYDAPAPGLPAGRGSARARQPLLELGELALERAVALPALAREPSGSASAAANGAAWLGLVPAVGEAALGARARRCRRRPPRAHSSASQRCTSRMPGLSMSSPPPGADELTTGRRVPPAPSARTSPVARRRLADEGVDERRLARRRKPPAARP